MAVLNLACSVRGPRAFSLRSFSNCDLANHVLIRSAIQFGPLISQTEHRSNFRAPLVEFLVSDAALFLLEASGRSEEPGADARPLAIVGSGSCFDLWALWGVRTREPRMPQPQPRNYFKRVQSLLEHYLSSLRSNAASHRN
jgi:hypothetical protein